MGKHIDPKKQFSKWLAKSGAIYWMLFHTALLVLMGLRPEVANACIYMSIIVSFIMALHVISYTENSISEKVLLTLAEKMDFNVSLKNASMSNLTSVRKLLKNLSKQDSSEDHEEESDDVDEEPEEDSEEGDGNG